MSRARSPESEGGQERRWEKQHNVLEASKSSEETLKKETEKCSKLVEDIEDTIFYLLPLLSSA